MEIWLHFDHRLCVFAALLYRPLDRVTKTTLVLRVRLFIDPSHSNFHLKNCLFPFGFLAFRRPLSHLSLILQDVLNSTPAEHADYASLQEALRLSRSFLSGVNESSQCKREVTLSHGMVSPQHVLYSPGNDEVLQDSGIRFVFHS